MKFDTTNPRPAVKPRLKRNPHGDEWTCTDKHVHAYGWGLSLEKAYELWLSRYRRILGVYHAT